MKKSIIVLSSMILFGVAFEGCKKGQNDPGISLHSRDARLTAKWKLTKIESTDVNGTSATISTTTIITYDGTTFSKGVTTPPLATVTSTGTGTYEMTIDKRGKISFNETYTPSGGTADITSGEGNWEWLSDSKNRDNILLDGSGNLFNGGLYAVDRLASKELVLTYTGKSVDNGVTDTMTDKYTFTKE